MTANTIGVREELDQAPLSRFHWFVVGCVFAATIVDGYDVFLPSYVIHFMTGPWHLSTGEAGWLASSALIGIGIGSTVQGVIADRIGRRPTMIGGLFLSGVFTLLTAFLANGLISFVILRFLTGLGMGVMLPLGAAYIAEYVPAKGRFRIATLAILGFNIGGIIVSVLGVLMAPAYGWRPLFMIVGFGGVLLGLVFLPVFPESVQYLVGRGRNREAAGVMVRVRPGRTSDYDGATFVMASPETVPAGPAEPAGPAASSGRYWLLPLRQPYLPVTIGLWLAAFFVIFDNYALSTWTPNLMVARGDSFAASFAFGAAFQGASVIGALLCGVSSDRWLGRRLSLMLWCGVGGVAVFCFLLVSNPVADLLMAAASGFCIIGALTMLNNVAAATYPAHARGTGVGYMLGLGRIGGILGPVVAGSLIAATGNSSVLFIVAGIGGFLAMGGVALTRNGSPSASTVRSVGTPIS
ncbi:MAG TPA: MFS transporter [Trebonia sp.]|jgi:AAHS family 4-hydroxybenzoate transporter-like MFS transporter